MPSPTASTGSSADAARLPARAGRRTVAALGGEAGQSTVEFALVTAGLLAVVIALGALWHLFGEGKAVEHALLSASHHIQLAAATAAADVFLY